MGDEEVSCIRPSAPSPPSGLSLVPFEDVTPSQSPNEWLNSPSRIHCRGRRVEVLSLIGDLLDNGWINDQDGIRCIKFAIESDENVRVLSDLMEARKELSAKAKFIKLFLAGRPPLHNPADTTPPTASTPIVPATIFDCSSTDESTSPVPLIYPKAVRIATVPILGTAMWPCIRGSMCEPKESPESAKSTNPGSSIDASPPINTLSLTRETTACSHVSPPKTWSAFEQKCAMNSEGDGDGCPSN